MILDIQSVTPAQVVSVYSGKAGKCMCGCAGNHRYNPDHAELGAKRRGYPVLAEDINMTQVTRVLRLIQAEPSALVEPGLNGGETILSARVGNRDLVAYLK